MARSFTAFALCLQWNDESEQNDTETVSLDDVFDVLSDRRRRYVLYCLHQHDRPVTVDTLARWIAALEAESPPEAVATDDVQRIVTDLSHSQLPRLADIPLINYDRDDDAVTIADDALQIQPYLLIAARDDLCPPDVPKP